MKIMTLLGQALLAVAACAACTDGYDDEHTVNHKEVQVQVTISPDPGVQENAPRENVYPQEEELGPGIRFPRDENGPVSPDELGAVRRPDLPNDDFVKPPEGPVGTPPTASEAAIAAQQTYFEAVAENERSWETLSDGDRERKRAELKRQLLLGVK